MKIEIPMAHVKVPTLIFDVLMIFQSILWIAILVWISYALASGLGQSTNPPVQRKLTARQSQQSAFCCSWLYRWKSVLRTVYSRNHLVSGLTCWSLCMIQLMFSGRISCLFKFSRNVSWSTPSSPVRLKERKWSTLQPWGFDGSSSLVVWSLSKPAGVWIISLLVCLKKEKEFLVCFLYILFEEKIMGFEWTLLQILSQLMFILYSIAGVICLQSWKWSWLIYWSFLF